MLSRRVNCGTPLEAVKLGVLFCILENTSGGMTGAISLYSPVMFFLHKMEKVRYIGESVHKTRCLGTAGETEESFPSAPSFSSGKIGSERYSDFPKVTRLFRMRLWFRAANSKKQYCVLLLLCCWQDINFRFIMAFKMSTAKQNQAVFGNENSLKGRCSHKTLHGTHTPEQGEQQPVQEWHRKIGCNSKYYKESDFLSK